jgi:hypothetical protein
MRDGAKNYLSPTFLSFGSKSGKFPLGAEKSMGKYIFGKKVFITHIKGWKSHKTLSYPSHSTHIYCHWEKFIDFLLPPPSEQKNLSICVKRPSCTHLILAFIHFKLA